MLKILSITQLYDITAACSIILLFVIYSITQFRSFLKFWNALLYKYLLYYSILFWWHHFFQLWTYAQVAIQLIYLAANIFCIMFRVSNMSKAATHAEHLSLINIISVYFEFHMSFVFNLLDISLFKYCIFHASTKYMSVLLDFLHVIMFDKSICLMNETSQLFRLIVDYLFQWSTQLS